MFNRKIISSLRSWAASETRKPLVLRGARQVGKTTAVDLFSREFDQYVYINLERPGQIDFFKRKMAVRDVFSAILLSKNMQPHEGRTLLFIDEIQQCPEAVDYLRYFHEEVPHLYVCAAGSLLEAMVTRGQINFPVGRVEFRDCFPLTFGEYLSALGRDEAVAAFSRLPLPDYAEDVLFKEFHTYALVGGMPEIVAAYSRNRDIASIAPMYHNLMTSFLDDIPKYARNPTQAQVLRHCLETAPGETGKRISFVKFGRSEYRSREAGEALRMLEQAILLHLIYPTTATELPAVPDMRKAPRLQFLDTGMLLAMSGLQQHFVSIDNLHSLYRGMVAEHIVGQELLAASSEMLQRPPFWVRENPQANAEVDFLLPWNGNLIPIEVKSGSTGTLRSLHQFIDRCPHDMAVRLYAGSIDVSPCTTIDGKKFRLLSLPYFLASKVIEYCMWAFGGG